LNLFFEGKINLNFIKSQMSNPHQKSQMSQ